MSEVMIEAVAGATGAAVAALATYPLLTLSTFQAVKRPRTDTDQTPLPPIYTFLDTVYQLTAVEGWKRLYDGLKPTLIGSATSQGMYFYCYSAFKNLITEGKRSMDVMESMGVAYLAGSVNVLVTNPIWVIATRMQWQRRGEKSVSRTLQSAFENNGYEWAFKGVVPSLLLVCNPAIQFTIYELLIRSTKRRTRKETIASSDVFWISAISKLGATLATYPLCLVKSRLQAYESRSRQSYRHAYDAILTIYNEEGWRGFYNGMPLKCLQSVTAAVITMVVKEKMTYLLKSLKKRQDVK